MKAKFTIYEDRRWRGIGAAATGVGVSGRAIRSWLAGNRTAISRDKAAQIRVVTKRR